MAQRKVVVSIETDGSVSIDAQGFKGSSCSLATKELELALVGGNAAGVDDKRKPDYYATNPQTNTQKN